MNKYIFILGNHPILSQAEIRSVIQYYKIDAFFKSVSTNTLLVNTKKELDCEKLIQQLGGTIRIAKVLAEFDGNYQINYSLKYLKNKDEKFRFGLSFFNLYINKIKIINYLKAIKKQYQGKLNYVIPKAHELSPSQVYNKLIKKGIEHIIVFEKNNHAYLAETAAIFDLRKYSKIDYKIPKSDAKKGMLPPKLANIMINLSLNNKFDNPIIYDPFCGYGRIVLQSILFGYQAIGSDIDLVAVESSKINCQWLVDQYELKNAKYNLFVQDATENIRLDKKINSLVSEPDLGKAYKSLPSNPEIDNSFKILTDKYLKSFGHFRNILEDQSKVIVVFPKINKISLLDRIIDKIKPLGYHKLEEFEYSRDYQIVKRHIGVFIFNKS